MQQQDAVVIAHTRKGIVWARTRTWHWQNIAHVRHSSTIRGAANPAHSLGYLRWIERRWNRRRIAAYKLAHRPNTYQRLSIYGWTGWDRVAQCESGGNWSLVTGNGFYWGLQWLPSTWDARAHRLGFPTWTWYMSHHAAPSRETQIRAATGMSLSNWPICGARY